MAACVVLKPRHSLIGKDLLPMLLELKSIIEPPPAFARLKKEHPLEKYTLEELETEFRKLTLKSAKDLLLLSGRPFDLEETRLLVHYSILFANSVGAPRGSALSASAPSEDVPGIYFML